ncbi:MAG TPA: hypothetical protein VGA07_09580 [Anaerolineales bacterium]
MADQSPDTGVRPTEDRPPSPPRWVKLMGIIALVVILLVVIILVTGLGGPHGPRRHTPSGDAASQTPLSSVVELQALPRPDPAGPTSRSSATVHSVQ